MCACVCDRGLCAARLPEQKRIGRKRAPEKETTRIAAHATHSTNANSTFTPPADKTINTIRTQVSLNPAATDGYSKCVCMVSSKEAGWR